MTLLNTASAVETNVLDTMTMVEDAVLRSTRALVEGIEPAKWMPLRPASSLLPTAPETVEHTFAFVDRVVANVRQFTTEFVDLLPAWAEPHTPAVKSAPKAHAA